MKYKNCPTCGGQAKFVSENFERAGILIAAEHEKDKKIVDDLISEIEFLSHIVDTGLNHISSDDLFYLYKRKKQQEIKETQIRIDEEYFSLSKDSERTSKLFEEGLKRMFGDI